MMTKIRNKLLLVFILLTLVPVIIISVYGVYSNTQALKASSIKKQNIKVSLLATEIDNFLLNVNSDLFYLRDASALQGLLEVRNDPLVDGAVKEKAWQRVSNDFLHFSEQRKIYHQIRFLDTDGQEVVRVNRPNNSSVIVSNDKMQNKKGRYYFDDAIKLGKGDVMISPLDLNREKGKIEEPIRPTIRYGTPVFDANNQLQGIVLVNVLASKFLSLLRDASDDKETLIMVDNKGYYLFHPDGNKTWGSERDKNSGENLLKDFPEFSEEVLSSAVLRTFSNGSNIISVNPVNIGENGDRSLGMIINMSPKEVIFAPVNQSRNIFILITLIALAVSVIIALIVSRAITQPITYLTKATHDMSKGQLVKPIKVESNDETHDLALSVERLRKSMKILMDKYNK